jgi:hypothetical protein
VACGLLSTVARSTLPVRPPLHARTHSLAGRRDQSLRAPLEPVAQTSAAGRSLAGAEADSALPLAPGLWCMVHTKDRRKRRAGAPVMRTEDAVPCLTWRARAARRAALPADSPALGPWANRAPLLVLGSHAWNAPNKAGRLACGPERQARVLSGAASGCGAPQPPRRPVPPAPCTACASLERRPSRASSRHGVHVNADHAADLEGVSARSARAPGYARVAPSEPSLLSALYRRVAGQGQCLSMLLRGCGSVRSFVADPVPTRNQPFAP